MKIHSLDEQKKSNGPEKINRRGFLKKILKPETLFIVTTTLTLVDKALIIKRSPVLNIWTSIFGDWEKYKGKQSFEQIWIVHEKVHKQGNIVIELVLKWKIKEVEYWIIEFNNLRKNLFDLLDKLYIEIALE